MKYITSLDRCQGICAKNITHFCSSKTARAVRVWPPVSGSILCPPLFCPCSGRRVQEAAPYRCHGPKTGGHMGQYKSLSGECRRGRTLAGPSRSFCHSGATLIRLASLGTFPLEGGRLAGDRKGRPYGFTKVHLSNRRAADSRPYGGFAKQLRAVRRGRRALQPSTSRHLIGKARRANGTAVATIFANPGPSGPAGI